MEFDKKLTDIFIIDIGIHPWVHYFFYRKTTPSGCIANPISYKYFHKILILNTDIVIKL